MHYGGVCVCVCLDEMESTVDIKKECFLRVFLCVCVPLFQSEMTEKA